MLDDWCGLLESEMALWQAELVLRTTGNPALSAVPLHSLTILGYIWNRDRYCYRIFPSSSAVNVSLIRFSEISKNSTRNIHLFVNTNTQHYTPLHAYVYGRHGLHWQARTLKVKNDSSAPLLPRHSGLPDLPRVGNLLPMIPVSCRKPLFLFFFFSEKSRNLQPTLVTEKQWAELTATQSSVFQNRITSALDLKATNVRTGSSFFLGSILYQVKVNRGTLCKMKSSLNVIYS